MILQEADKKCVSQETPDLASTAQACAHRMGSQPWTLRLVMAPCEVLASSARELLSA